MNKKDSFKKAITFYNAMFYKFCAKSDAYSLNTFCWS